MSEHFGRSREDYETLVLKELSKLPNNTESISNIITYLEDLEENINITIEEHSIALLQIQFLCYLINYDLENAKFFWSRIQNEKKTNPNLNEVYLILQQIWFGKPNVAFQLIGQIQNNNTNKSISILLRLLHNSIFDHILKEITLNYTNLPIKEFQSLLSLNEQDTHKTIQKLNWKTDEQLYVFPDAKYLMDKEKFKQINEEQIDQITKLVSFLDSLQ